MSLRLRLRTTSTIPICVEGVLPETTVGLSIEKASRLPVQQGNRTVRLGELFELSENPLPNQLCWQGDLSAVHWIGKGMNSGSIVIEGNVGRHTGSQMSGGTLTVNGNVSDYLGCEMRGGTIRINGNAMDWVGAAYHGNKSGINGGQIIVTGSAGSCAGMAMRRGTICIGGNCGRYPGWNMRAGTIVVGGESGGMIGKGMIRGTVIFADSTMKEKVVSQLPPTFTKSGYFRPVVVNAIGHWLVQNEVRLEVTAGNFEMYHGDHLKGGRGEVLIAT